jgi:hypothetical protein
MRPPGFAIDVRTRAVFFTVEQMRGTIGVQLCVAPTALLSVNAEFMTDETVENVVIVDIRDVCAKFGNRPCRQIVVAFVSLHKPLGSDEFLEQILGIVFRHFPVHSVDNVESID